MASEGGAEGGGGGGRSLSFPVVLIIGGRTSLLSGAVINTFLELSNKGQIKASTLVINDTIWDSDLEHLI